MVGKRKPLVLASTKSLLNSVLTSSKSELTNGIGGGRINKHPVGDGEGLQLRAGILRLSEKKPGGDSLDDAALIGVSTSVLKRLAITSGSLVIVKNVDANVRRVGQAVALDPPNVHDVSSNDEPLSYKPSSAMLVFPSHSFPLVHHVPLATEVAYVSPLLAFNLNLHISCLKLLLYHGEEYLASLFEIKEDSDTNGEASEDFSVHLDIEPLTESPS